MADSILDRLKRSFNVFMNRDPTRWPYDSGTSYSYSPTTPRLSGGHEKSIVSSIITRIAIDVAAMTVIHVQTDENGEYLETIDSELNDRLTYSANIDQTGRAFLQDVVITLLDEGCVAIVPVDWDSDGDEKTLYSIRVGKILQWFPTGVRIEVYDQNTGQRKEVIVKKNECCCIENPLYAVLNESNSTLQRLIRKLNLLDYIDEQSGSGKLDLIIQLPYSLKGDKRNTQAEDRIKKIESQLKDHKYGIAYIDAAEHVTQLNRPVDNNLMNQIEYLTAMLYSQLGLSTAVFDGTADEKQMLNYYNRTVEPLLAAITDEMNRKFISQDARKSGERIMSFRDPFRLVPVEQLAEIADKFTRNEIMTANEIRQVIGMRLAADPNANVLKNANVSQSPDIQVVDVNGNTVQNSNGNTSQQPEQRNSDLPKTE